MEVVEPGWPSRATPGEPRFIEPPARVQKRIARDRAAFEAAYARPFVPPAPAGLRLAAAGRTTGRFGDQRVFNGVKQSVHYGTGHDRVGRWPPVRAANDGVVVLVRDAYLPGKDRRSSGTARTSSPPTST